MKSKKLYELPVISIYNADSTVALPTNGPAGNTTLKEALIAGLLNYDRFTAGAGQDITLKASDGFTSGAGGSIILQPGAQVTTGGDGVSILKQTAASSYANFAELKTSANSLLGSVNNGGTLIVPSVTTNLTTSQNDLALGNQRVHRINCTVASDITGIAPATGTSHLDGREIRLYNTGTANITLKHASSSSTAANRLYAFNVSPSRSLYTNGSQYLAATNNTTLMSQGYPWFLCFWVYPLTNLTMRGLAVKYNSSGTEFDYNFWALDTNQFRFLGHGDQLLVSGVTANTWQFVFAYVNTQNLQKGMCKNNGSFTTGNATVSQGSLANFSICGSYSALGTNGLNGYMDGVCLGKCKNDNWLTNNVTALRDYLYNSGNGRHASEFASSSYYSAIQYASWWDLDEASGTRRDSIGTNHMTNGDTAAGFSSGKILSPINDVIIYPGEYAELIYDSTDNGNGMAGWRMI